MGHTLQINRSRNHVRVERRSDLIIIKMNKLSITGVINKNVFDHDNIFINVIGRVQQKTR